jgi:hypothetical protein
MGTRGLHEPAQVDLIVHVLELIDVGRLNRDGVVKMGL